MLMGDALWPLIVAGLRHLSGNANREQECRYGTYKLVQKMPGGERMVAFTRILHRTEPDSIMDEVSAGWITQANSRGH